MKEYLYSWKIICILTAFVFSNKVILHQIIYFYINFNPYPNGTDSDKLLPLV